VFGNPQERYGFGHARARYVRGARHILYSESVERGLLGPQRQCLGARISRGRRTRRGDHGVELGQRAAQHVQVLVPRRLGPGMVVQELRDAARERDVEDGFLRWGGIRLSPQSGAFEKIEHL
jgi:hypothetical protein